MRSGLQVAECHKLSMRSIVWNRMGAWPLASCIYLDNAIEGEGQQLSSKEKSPVLWPLHWNNGGNLLHLP
jgi:hypothetical protein